MFILHFLAAITVAVSATPVTDMSLSMSGRIISPDSAMVTIRADSAMMIRSASIIFTYDTLQAEPAEIFVSYQAFGTTARTTWNARHDTIYSGLACDEAISLIDDSTLVVLHFRLKSGFTGDSLSLKWVSSTTVDDYSPQLHTPTSIEDGSQPDEPILFQNAPNPFNPTTLIRFFLPESGTVNIAVYDALGQQVCVLTDEWRAAGHHAIMWNGRDNMNRAVANGPYFVRMVYRDHSSVRRMTMIR